MGGRVLVLAAGMSAALMAEAGRVLRDQGYDPEFSEGPLRADEIRLLEDVPVPQEPDMKRLAEKDFYRLAREPRERTRDWDNNRRGRMKPRRR